MREWTGKTVAGALLSISGTLAASPPAEAQESKTSATDLSEIVVLAQRMPTSPDAIDRYSESSIGTLGAMTIGEVIARLERREGGRPLSIIVNGRRLADISDLREVPPEALAQIEILPSSSAGRYGFSPQQKVLNLVLKSKFSSISADASARLPTEGGGASGVGGLRYTNIRSERRFNGAATVSGGEALYGRDRLALLDDAARDGLTPYRALMPSSRGVSLTSGVAVPVGSTSLNVSLSMSDTTTRQLARFFQAGALAADGTIDARGIIDTTQARSYRLGVSGAGSIDRINWTAELTGSLNAGRTRSALSKTTIAGLSVQGDDATLPQSYAPLATATNNASIGGALSANAPLLAWSPGEITANTRLSTTMQRLVSRSGAEVGRRIDTQTRTTAHVGLEIPLVSQDVPVIGAIGMVSLSASGDYEKVSGMDVAPSHDLSLAWQPAGFMSVSLSRRSTRSIPAFSQSSDPVIYRPGMLVVDVATGDNALVTLITGGASDLRATTQADTLASISLNRSIRSTNVSTTVEYSASVISNPLIYAAYPNALFQRLFPDRFTRDDAGRLVMVDTRPFSASEERRSALRTSLHFSGRTGRAAKEADLAGSGITWDLSLTHEWTLRDELSPSAGAPTVDLLRTPLDGVQGTPRHKLNVEASFSHRSLNVQLSGRWRSGLKVEDMTAAEAYSVRYDDFWTADAEVSWTFGRSGGAEAKPLRLSLGVQNMFDKRLSVRDSNGQTPRQFLPAFLDPLGRVVTIRASRAF